MSEKIVDTTVARQIESTIRQLDSLSTLPAVATRFLSQLNQFRLGPSSLAGIVETDPAFAAKFLSLMYQQGVNFTEKDASVGQVLGKLPLQSIRDAFLSLKVYQASDDPARELLRKQLMLHALAVGCCAHAIASLILSQRDSQLAYWAGLLHNIGNLALDEAMPRSFATIVAEARSEETCICAVQHKHLGLDYTILGKRLAQKWHLPDEITMAIWLHRTRTATILQSMPGAKIAQTVQLAYLIARQCVIGQSGSYEPIAAPEKIGGSLGITPEQLQQIREDLPGAVERKSALLDLDAPQSQASYYDALHITASQLAHEHTELSVENRRLHTSSNHFDFMKEFLLSVDSESTAVDVAEDFATRWQKFYQTGSVCLYLLSSNNLPYLDAVVVESPTQTRYVMLKAPDNALLIPQEAAEKFTILNVDGHIDWLLDQLQVDFDLSRTKFVPLLSKGKAVGAIVFEFSYPADMTKIQEGFEVSTSIAASVLEILLAGQKQQVFAEQFVQLITKCQNAALQEDMKTPAQVAPVQTTSDNYVDVLAEMAAGAAHELNNPLAVISGRTQLLDNTETDPEKKQILKQVRESADEIARIIDGLMSFAKPQEPRAAHASIKQILDEAVQLTIRKLGIEHINIQINLDAASENVFVDSAQVVSAISNILCNSLESYSGDLGPVKVTAEPDESEDFEMLQFSDLGCGMDAETLQKATHPFFSVRPAGRKRGMGLAYALRLIQLNNGSLDIASQPAEGTTVTILLPRKQSLKSPKTLAG